MRALALKQDWDAVAMRDCIGQAQLLRLMRKVYGHYLEMVPDAG